MKKKRILLALLPFALLFAGTWLADQSSPHAHLQTEDLGTPFRVLAEIEGPATGLNADWVCVQDTLNHHAGKVLKADGHATSGRLALDLCCAPDSPEDPASDTQFRLKMDFIHYGVDASLNEITASLQESGLHLKNLQQVGHEVHGELAGLLDHPDHPGEQVLIDGAKVRFKMFEIRSSIG